MPGVASCPSAPPPHPCSTAYCTTPACSSSTDGGVRGWRRAHCDRVTRRGRRCRPLRRFGRRATRPPCSWRLHPGPPLRDDPAAHGHHHTKPNHADRGTQLWSPVGGRAYAASPAPTYRIIGGSPYPRTSWEVQAPRTLRVVLRAQEEGGDVDWVRDRTAPRPRADVMHARRARRLRGAQSVFATRHPQVVSAGYPAARPRLPGRAGQGAQPSRHGSGRGGRPQ